MTVKATFDLPDELVRDVKLRAVHENRSLKEVVADLLRRGLTVESPPTGEIRRRVSLPLVDCAHPAHEDDEMTPDRVASVLLDQEVDGSVTR